MNKHLLRCIALLLVPCLLSDPVTAAVLYNPFQAAKLPAATFSAFQTEALSGGVELVLHVYQSSSYKIRRSFPLLLPKTPPAWLDRFMIPIRFAQEINTPESPAPVILDYLKRHPVSEPQLWPQMRDWWIAHREELRQATNTPRLGLPQVGLAVVAHARYSSLPVLDIAERGRFLDSVLDAPGLFKTVLDHAVARIPLGRFSSIASRQFINALETELRQEPDIQPYTGANGHFYVLVEEWAAVYHASLQESLARAPAETFVPVLFAAPPVHWEPPALTEEPADHTPERLLILDLKDRLKNYRQGARNGRNGHTPFILDVVQDALQAYRDQLENPSDPANKLFIAVVDQALRSHRGIFPPSEDSAGRRAFIASALIKVKADLDYVHGPLTAEAAAQLERVLADIGPVAPPAWKTGVRKLVRFLRNWRILPALTAGLVFVYSTRLSAAGIVSSDPTAQEWISVVAFYGGLYLMGVSAVVLTAGAIFYRYSNRPDRNGYPQDPGGAKTAFRLMILGSGIGLLGGTLFFGGTLGLASLMAVGMAVSKRTSSKPRVYIDREHTSYGKKVRTHGSPNVEPEEGRRAPGRSSIRSDGRLAGRSPYEEDNEDGIATVPSLAVLAVISSIALAAMRWPAALSFLGTAAAVWPGRKALLHAA